jgi:hypothetical protein
MRKAKLLFEKPGYYSVYKGSTDTWWNHLRIKLFSRRKFMAYKNDKLVYKLHLFTVRIPKKLWDKL